MPGVRTSLVARLVSRNVTWLLRQEAPKPSSAVREHCDVVRARVSERSLHVAVPPVKYRCTPRPSSRLGSPQNNKNISAPANRQSTSLGTSRAHASVHEAALIKDRRWFRRHGPSTQGWLNRQREHTVRQTARQQQMWSAHTPDQPTRQSDDSIYPACNTNKTCPTRSTHESSHAIRSTTHHYQHTTTTTNNDEQRHQHPTTTTA